LKTMKDMNHNMIMMMKNNLKNIYKAGHEVAEHQQDLCLVPHPIPQLVYPQQLGHAGLVIVLHQQVLFERHQHNKS
jgi:hypothetical protein